MTFPQSPRRKAGFWTPVRVTLTLTALALVAAFGASSCGQPAEVARTDNGAPKINSPTAPSKTSAPASNATPAAATLTPLPASVLNAQLKTLDGTSFKLSDFAGKVLVINLWATWCGPCRIETPDLVELSKEYKGRGVEVVGLDIDPERESPEMVREFMRQYNVSYKVAFAERDLALALMRDSGNIPQNLVITRDGRILTKLVGFNPQTSPARLRTAVEQALSHNN